ncbi:MAG: DUF2946 family protein [Pseudomonadota bacterium]
MGRLSHFCALLAAMILAVTGGTMTLDLSGEGPTITVCSHEGSYEIPLDMGGTSDTATELCCGSCVPLDHTGSLGSHPWRPLLDAKAREIGVALASALANEPHWTHPPSRGPPSFV